MLKLAGALNRLPAPDSRGLAGVQKGGETMKNYVKYTWVGNKITSDNMTKLYHLKTATKKPITVLVSEAISEYLIKREVSL